MFSSNLTVVMPLMVLANQGFIVNTRCLEGKVKMDNLQKPRTTIGIKTTTKDKLDKNRAPGQCYDGFIWQLVDLWERTSGNGR